MHTMDGLDVAPDLINELGELLQVHCGTILCVLHILNALHQRILQLSLNLVGGGGGGGGGGSSAAHTKQK